MNTRMLTAALASVVCSLVAGACHHDDAKPTTPVATPTPTTPPPAADDKKPEPQVTSDQKVSPGLALGADIVQLCGIKPMASATPSGANPTFDYDKDELTADDRAVLEQLATCLTTGALKGKPVSLIGRADPRGTDDYNLALGSRRATSVGAYLGRLGVGQAQLAVTTRGSIDATGTDEAGWRQDRRVDVQLKVN